MARKARPGGGAGGGTEARTEGRSVPQALRRGLTFWRRSIQARVAVSTLLVSAIVVSAVGWFLLRQIEQGLVDHRVAAVLTEVPTTMPGVRVVVPSGWSVTMVV